MPEYRSFMGVQADVARWARETFPDQSDLSVARHLVEEANELLAVVERDGRLSADGYEEVADVAMLLMVLADQRFLDIAGLVARKLEVNRGRSWTFDDILGYHKKFSEGQES